MLLTCLEPGLSLLAADEQREPRAVSSHGRRYTLGLSCAGIRPVRYAEERSPIQREGSSSEVVLALDDVGDERQAEDQSERFQKDHQKDWPRQSVTLRGKRE